MNAMRLKEGVPANLFLQRTGIPLKVMEKELSIAVERKLLDWQLNELKPTIKGQRYLNELLQMFVK